MNKFFIFLALFFGFISANYASEDKVIEICDLDDHKRQAAMFDQIQAELDQECYREGLEKFRLECAAQGIEFSEEAYQESQQRCHFSEEDYAPEKLTPEEIEQKRLRDVAEAERTDAMRKEMLTYEKYLVERTLSLISYDKSNLYENYLQKHNSDTLKRFFIEKAKYDERLKDHAFAEKINNFESLDFRDQLEIIDVQKPFEDVIIERRKYRSTATLDFIRSEKLYEQKYGRKILKVLAQYPNEMELGGTVSGNASFKLFNYYIGIYNQCVQNAGGSHKPNAPLIASLRKANKWLSFGDDANFYLDDPSCPGAYTSDFIQKKLSVYFLWNININNKKDVMSSLFIIRPEFFNLLEIAYGLFQCETYESTAVHRYVPSSYDLLDRLVMLRFWGEKQDLDKAGTFQHLWVHERLPLQIRLTNEGKLKIALVKEIPIQNGKFNKGLIGRGSSNERLKLTSAEKGAFALIPAFHKDREGVSYQNLWEDEKSVQMDSRKDMMASAHRQLRTESLDFETASRFFDPNRPAKSLYNKAPEKKDPPLKKKGKLAGSQKRKKS